MTSISLDRFSRFTDSGFSSRWLPRAATVLMILLVGYLLYQIALYLTAGDGEPVSVVADDAPRKTTATSTRSKADSGRQVASMHLFGQANRPAAAAVKKTTEAPDTKLNLTLRGIFAQNRQDEGFAIIQDNRNKNESHFVAGQDVFALATLEEIYQDRVILQRKGQYETLRLPELSLPRKHYTESEDVEAAKRRVATDYRRRFLAGDGMDLKDLFGFDTAYKSGSFIGFMVKALGPEGQEMMDVLGLVDGDLITVVNGLRLNESYDAVTQLKDLKTATSVNFIVERDGNEIPFHIAFDPPAEDSVPDGNGSAGTVAGSGGAASGSGSGFAAGGGVESGVSSASSSSGSPVSPGSSGEPEEVIELDWAQTPEAAEYRAKQRARMTGAPAPVEFDH